MCQLLGMNAATPTDFSFSFRGFAKRGGETDKHENGWGLALYEGRGLRTFHDPLPAAKSRVAAFVAGYPMKTLNMMAHIRYATQGEVSLENVHPFQREMWGIQWCFAHNGEVAMYTDTVPGEYPTLGRTNPRDLFYHPVGDTDSEKVFCGILNALRAEFVELPTLPNLYEALQRICAEVVHGREDSTILNFLLGCGQYTLFAYSWPGARPGSDIWNGLYYTIRRPPFSKAKLVDEDYAVDFSEVTTPSDRVAVIATAPLTVDEEWNEFKRGQLLMFDKGWGFSELYDCHEVELQGRGLCSNAMPKASNEGYDTPAMLRKVVDSVVEEPRRHTVWARKGADIGCGSGCAGVAFRSCIKHMTGVDLSPEMVDRARERGCYDHLLVGDIESVMSMCQKDPASKSDFQPAQIEDVSFDIIFACNVFSYILDMRGVFQSVCNSLRRNGGVFAFSAEFIEGREDSKERFVLQSCARYAHVQSYIEELAVEFGFETKEMVTTSDVLRQHNGRVVKGVLVVLMSATA